MDMKIYYSATVRLYGKQGVDNKTILALHEYFGPGWMVGRMMWNPVEGAMEYEMIHAEGVKGQLDD